HLRRLDAQQRVEERDRARQVGHVQRDVELHGIAHVASPVRWEQTGGVDFYSRPQSTEFKRSARARRQRIGPLPLAGEGSLFDRTNKPGEGKPTPTQEHAPPSEGAEGSPLTRFACVHKRTTLSRKWERAKTLAPYEPRRLKSADRGRLQKRAADLRERASLE